MDVSLTIRRSSHSLAGTSRGATFRTPVGTAPAFPKPSWSQSNTLAPLRPCDQSHSSRLSITNSSRRGPDYPGSGYQQRQRVRKQDASNWQQQFPQQFNMTTQDVGKLLPVGLGALGLALVAGPILGAMALAGGIAAATLVTVGGAFFMTAGLFLPFVAAALFMTLFGGMLGLFATISALVPLFGLLAGGAFLFSYSRSLKRGGVGGASSAFGGSESGVWEVEVEGEDPEDAKRRRQQEEDAADARRVQAELDDFDRLLRQREGRRRSNSTRPY